MSMTTTDYRCVCGREIALPFDHDCACGASVTQDAAHEVMPCAGGPLNGQRVTLAEMHHNRTTREVPAAWQGWHAAAFATWDAGRDARREARR